MLGKNTLEIKNVNYPKKRINIEDDTNMNNIIKQNLRKKFIEGLIKKYFTKIVNKVNNEKEKNKTSCVFYFNYYDLKNNGLGHPSLIMNEIMHEMCYIYSEYIEDDNILQKYLGDKFRFTVKHKNMIFLEWN